MATINDFKIINQKSKKFFDLLRQEYKPCRPIAKDKDKERYGFYFFVLESITGHRDFSDLIDIITDQDFNTRFFKKNDDDLGIDAVNIDDEKNIIQLFNFKFKEKFSIDKSTINEAIITTKFINAIKTSNTQGLTGKIEYYVNEIIEKLNSSEEWQLELYLVSNEDFSFKKSVEIENLEQIYGLKVKNIGLSEICNYVSIRPKPINASIVIDDDGIMSYSENSLSSLKSYIIRLPLSEIVRITCDDERLRDQYHIEEVSVLSNATFDFSVLFDNVRGFVTKSKFNKNIQKTLDEESEKFFIYNNGLTIICADIKSNPINTGKKIKLELTNMQVVNGGQTLRTIHKFNSMDKTNIENSLSNSQILVRLFNVSNDPDLNNKIAEYTNSQNAISNIDLKSLKSEQIHIEQYLSDHDILYIRKSGDTGKDDKEYRKRISMEKFGQLLFALEGYPQKTTNQKRGIFDKFYDSLFIDNFVLEDSIKIINKYFHIKDIYHQTVNNVTEQKVFYVMYLDDRLNENTKTLIERFECCIQNFQPEDNKEISPARKLIRNDFKDFVDDEFNIYISI